MEALEATAAVQTSYGGVRFSFPHFILSFVRMNGTYNVGSGQIVQESRDTPLPGRSDRDVEHPLAALIGFLKSQIPHVCPDAVF